MAIKYAKLKLFLVIADSVNIFLANYSKFNPDNFDETNILHNLIKLFDKRNSRW